MSDNPFASPETYPVPKNLSLEGNEGSTGELKRQYFYHAKSFKNSTLLCFLPLITGLIFGIPGIGLLLMLLFPSLGSGFLGPFIYISFFSLIFTVLAIPVSYQTYLRLVKEPALKIWDDGVTVLFVKTKWKNIEKIIKKDNKILFHKKSLRVDTLDYSFIHEESMDGIIATIERHSDLQVVK
jgi:hypothetical protein